MTGRSKRGLRTQFAALCFRIRDGQTQVLLITSRTRKRWILPKGWPMDGRSPAQAAKQEAWEEAGATGRAYPQCLGVYHYRKTSGPEKGLPCLAAVFPLRVKKLRKTFPERNQRRRKWFSLAEAAERVSEPELKVILASFDPKSLKPRSVEGI